MNKNIAYYSSVTEYESGWGNRPDGYLVAIDKESFLSRAKLIESQGDSQEFSRIDHEPKLCLVTDEMYAQLKEVSTVWTSNKRDWLIEG